MVVNQREQMIIGEIWPIFFPKDEFFIGHKKMKAIEMFYETFRQTKALQYLDFDGFKEGIRSAYLSIQELCDILQFPDVSFTLRTNPKEVIGCLGIAISLIVTLKIGEEGSLPILIRPRFINFKPESTFGELKSGAVGQMVAIRGYVVKTSNCRPMVVSAPFLCSKCSTETWSFFDDGIFAPPTECSNKECGNKYALEIQRIRAVTCDFQKIKVQELEMIEDDVARIPRSFDVEVRHDLINMCIPGDIVKIVGVIKTIQNEAPRNFKGNKRESGLHTLYLVANSLVKIKKISSVANDKDNDKNNDNMIPNRDPKHIFSGGSGSTQADFSAAKKLLGSIRSMAYANGGTCLGLLIASLCPTIFGHELVKAGLLLGLFGGTKNQTDSKVNVRSDIHVLIVGDPGLGKSQMLRAASSIAPRAVYVCGNTSTTAGLTVAISREGRGGETTIEAGALVLSDQGVCCIDELDKMSCDPHALLEAMEQQSISIAKSGMVTSLKSRASVLAAANPIGGHYNRRKTVCENLKMATALLTRFDLVFILLDKPDDGHDRKISEHIMRTHALASNLADTSVISDDMFTGFKPYDSHIENNDSSEMTLSQRLRREANFFSERPLNPDILRKYVEFARQHIHPKLTAAAAKVLQRLYLTLRSQQSLGKSIPVTTRHLESLIRLSQARAKVELRDEVTEDDAKDVVQLLQESLLDAFTTETGEIDLKRKGGMSIAKQVKALAQMLSKEANLKGSTMFSRVEILEIILRMKLEKDGNSLIDVMMTESYLLAKGNKTYQLAAT